MPFATCFRLIGILLLLPLSAAPVGASAAGIGRDKGGRPVVLLDGEPVSLGPGVVHHQSREFTEAFDRAGIATIVLSANLGMYHSRLSYFAPLKHMREFWRGYRDYDASQIEALLAPPVAANPRVKILLWLGVDPYPEFGQRHPDSIIRNDRGDALIATTHFARFDAAPPQAGPGKPEHYGISFFSEAYRTEAAEMLSAFIRGVEASPHGGHVIGYLLGRMGSSTAGRRRTATCRTPRRTGAITRRPPGAPSLIGSSNAMAATSRPSTPPGRRRWPLSPRRRLPRRPTCAA